MQYYTVIQTLERMLPKQNFKLTYTRDTKILQGPNGICEFKSDEQGWKAYQGRALDGAWPDEEHSEEVFNQLSKRLKAGRGLEMWFTMTAEPDRPDHWTFDRLALPALNPETMQDYDHFKFDLNDNRVSRGGYIDDKLIDTLIAQTPEADRPAVIHGEYVRRGGLMYPMWDRNVHVVPSVPLQDLLRGVQQGVYTAYGSLDWGVRNPTCINLWLVDKEGRVQLVDEIYRPAIDTDDIKAEYNKRFAVFHPVDIFADPTIWYSEKSTNDPTKTVGYKLEQDDLKKHLKGLPLVAAENDHVSGHAAVRDLLRIDPKLGPLLTVHDRCVNNIREVEAYVGEEFATAAMQRNRNKKERGKPVNDHAMDTWRYFATAPYAHIPMRRHGAQPTLRANPITGYLRPV